MSDFIEKARDEGCQIVKNALGTFIGNNPATNYPHIHIWKDGTIALSAGKGQNGKIGRYDEIDIDELISQYDRYGRHVVNGLEETISWVMRSDS